MYASPDFNELQVSPALCVLPPEHGTNSQNTYQKRRGYWTSAAITICTTKAEDCLTTLAYYFPSQFHYACIDGWFYFRQWSSTLYRFCSGRCLYVNWCPLAATLLFLRGWSRTYIGTHLKLCKKYTRQPRSHVSQSGHSRIIAMQRFVVVCFAVIISTRIISIILADFSSLNPGGFESNFQADISDWWLPFEIVLRWMSLDVNDDKSTMVQVMVSCRRRQAITWTNID